MIKSQVGIILCCFVMSMSIGIVAQNTSSDSNVSLASAVSTEEIAEKSEESYYMMPVKSLDVATGKVTHSEIQVEGYKPVKTRAAGESYWERVIREAEKAGLHPLEYYSQRSAKNDKDRAILQNTQIQVENTQIAPYDAICFLELEYTGFSTPRWGTGFWVNNDTILTCAHNVWPIEPEKFGYLQGINIFTGRNGDESTSLGIIKSGMLTILAPEEWGDNDQYPEAYDYAVIKVNASGGTVHSNLSLSTEFSIDDIYTLAGYPDDKAHQMWKDSGTVFEMSARPGQLCYKIDERAGQSGAPVFKGTTAIGINAYERVFGDEYIYNIATKITNEVIALTE